VFKNSILFFISFLLFFLPSLARADVVINEVQLSPTDGRFLELYNDGSSAVDLTGWYMQRKTATGGSFGSLVSNPNFEGKIINAHDYFVISRNSLSNSDIVLDSLTLTESNTIQIKNSSGGVVDKVGWGDASDCSSPCPDNPPDGKSIQKSSSGSWVSASPTPGSENNDTDTASPADDNNNTNDDEDNPSSGSAPTPAPVVIKNPTMKAKIITRTLAFAGEPFKIDANIFGFSDEKIVLGKIYWNFGDGSSFEQINNFEEFYHTYFYPGEYAVSLEYYLRIDSQIPEIANKMIIKVLPTTVTISKVGNAQDFFVELTNSANSDIDISNWFINANGKIFILPRNSTIMSKKSMTISSRLTGFNVGDKYDLKLFSSTGELIFNYNAPSARIVTTKTVSSSSNSPKTETSLDSNDQPSALDLSANALESNSSDKSNTNDSYLFSLGLFALLSISGSAVYFIRKTKTTSNPGNDFEILDE